MDVDGAYGAGKAGTAFNPLEFFQRPPVILRILNIVSNWLYCTFVTTIFPWESETSQVSIPCLTVDTLVDLLMCWIILLQLFSIIVFGSISSQGYHLLNGKEVCLYNADGNACNYGVGIGESFFHRDPIITLWISNRTLNFLHCFPQVSSHSWPRLCSWLPSIYSLKCRRWKPGATLLSEISDFQVPLSFSILKISFS